MDTLKQYSHQQNVLPAMGYSDQQIDDMQQTIAAAADSGSVDTIIIATPIDLSRILKIPSGVASVRVRYDLQEIGLPNLTTILQQFNSERLSEVTHDEPAHFSG